MVKTNLLVIFFFLPGVLLLCPKWSNLFISTPKRMEALGGSCLYIPCNFWARYRDNFSTVNSKTFGIWIKSHPDLKASPHNVIFNSSRTVSTYPMKMVGNLQQKHCTTLLSHLLLNHTDTYYFRIEKWPFRETALCDPLQLTVKDSAPSPRLEIPADLKEKESVTITCSAVTPCPLFPPKLIWTLRQDSHNIMEKNPDGTFTTKIQETIDLTDKHDGYNISCSATYPVNEGRDNKTAEETKTLSVSYAPKNTSVSISPPGLLSAGVNVTLSCSSRAKPPVSSFTWFKMSSDGPMNISEGETYSFNVTEGGVYYCVAKNDLGTHTSSETQKNKGI
ncbi:sialic acid-binding Ig-like lectin 14 [Cheilinus undulatus]|uniref:sialic acid-binding Ig-like lectin 14 n=1 Tax=Cheilinus undulatus TaxID=241271 RepID=UPI001BD6D4B2|nr:sialic acid-binding Ig-like lectin 14 [Cheilinus undulatus]